LSIPPERRPDLFSFFSLAACWVHPLVL